MTSHEYAEKVKEAAEYLLSRPEFDTQTFEAPTLYMGWYYTNKEQFLLAARALGSGQKVYTSTDLEFTSLHGAKLHISASRSAVCKKIQDEKWECEPLLSGEEEYSIPAEDEIPF